uniref:glycosyltransferase n=1 Tax=Mariniflexile sp. TaxID=1979402 RepID=UPI004047E5FD
MNYNNSPLVSIIIPIYNVELYLERCVSTITHQTYKNLEIILVNDGSTDSSGEICDTYKNNDSRIKVIHQENGGLSMARNTGLEIASGDYIGFVDSDDWVELDMINSMLAFALQHQLDVVECDIINSFNYAKKQFRAVTKVIETKTDALERIMRNREFSVWRRIYSAGIIKNMRFIPGKIYEDVPFTSEIFDKIEHIGYINYPYYIYFIENESITRSENSVKKINSLDVFLSLKKYSHNYNEKTKYLADEIIANFLANSYNSLFIQNDLDKNFVYRKQIKNSIKNLSTNYYNSNKLALIRTTPIWLYSLLINIRYKLKKS